MTVRTDPSGKHSHPLPGRVFLLLIALCLAGLVMGLAAIRPILTAVLHPGEYTATVTLNWGLSLPESGGCVYEADSGSSFHGDGERYHVLSYPPGSTVETALSWQDAPLGDAPAAEITRLMDDLSIPEEERPDPDQCRWYTATDPDDPRNCLYLLLSALGTRLYILESFL